MSRVKWIYSSLKTLCLILLAGSAPTACNDIEPQTLAPESTAKVVEVKGLGELTDSIKTRAPARIVALNDSQIRSEISATVVDVLHRQGDNITAGSVILNLDCRTYRAQQKRAGARLDIGVSELNVDKKDYLRHQELLKQELISEEVYLEKESRFKIAEANVRIARSELDIANRDVDNCTVRTPFDATVMEVSAAVGEMMSVGAALARIVDTSAIEIWAELDPLYAQGMTLGYRAQFVQNNLTIPVRLISKSLIPDLQSGNYKTRFAIETTNFNASGSGELVWQTNEKYLDDSYLRTYRGETGILVARAEKAVFIPIEGAQFGRYTASKSLDLDENLLVIVASEELVVDGDELIYSQANDKPGATLIP